MWESHACIMFNTNVFGNIVIGIKHTTLQLLKKRYVIVYVALTWLLRPNNVQLHRIKDRSFSMSIIILFDTALQIQDYFVQLSSSTLPKTKFHKYVIRTDVNITNSIKSMQLELSLSSNAFKCYRLKKMIKYNRHLVSLVSKWCA